MNIAIMYQISEKNDAEHAFEVLQNEAQSFRIPSEQIGKDKLRFVDITFQFVNIEKDEKWKNKKNIFDKIYTSQKIKKEYEEELKEKTENIHIITFPTQGIVDYVREIEQHRNSIQITILSEKEELVLQ